MRGDEALGLKKETRSSKLAFRSGSDNAHGTMSTLNPHHSQIRQDWLRVPVWLAAFLSPTVYVLLVMIMDRIQAPAPSEGMVVLLFCLIPVVGLLTCGMVVWSSKLSLRWRVGGVVFTVLAMLVQCGVWLAIIVSAITVTISPVQ